MTAPRGGGRVVAIAAIALLVAAAAAVQPAPGTVLNADTWPQAQNLLPPEFLDRYKNGQWRHEVVEPPAGTHFADEDFLAAGQKNAGQYALGPDGGIVESGSGKQPPFLYGPPFPVIDTNDPQAGAKIVWNFFYQSYLLGNSHNQVNLDWVGASGMQRSIGTDVYQHFFDGQPEDFDWKLVGEGEMLVLMDRAALMDKACDITRLPSGGFEGKDGLLPRFAYQTKDFTGLAWRPLESEFVLVKRPVWLVEGTPKDKYYLYGKVALRFDKEAWRGTYNSRYDWQGQILNSYRPAYGPFFDVDGEWRSYAKSLFTMAQNWKLDRATVSYADPKAPAQQSRITFPEGFFNVDQLSRQGK